MHSRLFTGKGATSYFTFQTPNAQET